MCGTFFESDGIKEGLFRLSHGFAGEGCFYFISVSRNADMALKVYAQLTRQSCSLP